MGHQTCFCRMCCFIIKPTCMLFKPSFFFCPHFISLFLSCWFTSLPKINLIKTSTTDIFIPLINTVLTHKAASPHHDRDPMNNTLYCPNKTLISCIFSLQVCPALSDIHVLAGPVSSEENKFVELHLWKPAPRNTTCQRYKTDYTTLSNRNHTSTFPQCIFF